MSDAAGGGAPGPSMPRWRRAAAELLGGGRGALLMPLALAVLVVLFPLYDASLYWIREISLIAVLALVVSGVNLSFGYAGEVQFGQVFMFALGAYVTMILATRVIDEIVPLLLIGGAVAAAVGFLVALPALRIGGWSLAMASFFLVLTIPEIVAIFGGYTGASNGLIGIPAPKLFGATLSNTGLYEVAVITALLWLACYRNLVTSRYGSTFRILRQSPVLAQSLGFSTLRLKVLAYALGALPAGMAGCLFGFVSLIITPSDFGLSLTIGAVAGSVLGGVESVYGAVVAAAVLQLGPEQSLSFADYAPIAYGLFLVFAAVLLRRGLGGLATQAARRMSVRLAGAPVQAVPLQADDPPLLPGDGAPIEPMLAPLPGRRIEVHAISKRFGGVRALDDVSLAAEPGRVTGLIGANGSGKTTMLNAICGLVRPEHGRATLGGHRLLGLAPHRIAALGIGRTFQTPSIPSATSVVEAVAAGGFRTMPCGLLASILRLPSYRRARRADRARALAMLELVGLAPLANAEAASLPLGTRRLLEVARALCGEPGVLLLDEPASGLSDEEVQRLGAVVRAAARAGATVILIEHNFGFVGSVCDVVHVLHLGQLLASGPAAEVASDPRVIESYLGGSGAVTAAQPRSPQEARGHAGVGPALRLTGVESGYGDLRVLRGVDLALRAGCIHALLGRNGVGKTTLLAATSGQIPLWRGAIELGGSDIGSQAPYRRAAAGLALVQEGKRIFRHRTIAENVELGTHALRIGRSERAALCAAALEQFPVLAERSRERADGLSGGQQQMLAIAQALAAQPRVLMLDEPSAGLAPAIVDEVFARLRALADAGLTVLLVEQLADRAMQIADEVAVMEGGRIVAAGAPGEFRDMSQLQDVYFGAVSTP